MSDNQAELRKKVRGLMVAAFFMGTGTIVVLSCALLLMTDRNNPFAPVAIIVAAFSFFALTMGIHESDVVDLWKDKQPNGNGAKAPQTG